MTRPTKLKDVAKASGVSQGTASNVFNRPELVRPELRVRVEAAAAALGYSGPDPKGRLLRAGKFNVIGIVPGGAYGISDAFADASMRDFMMGVAAACDAESANLTLVSGVDEDKARGIRNAFVDGFILYRPQDGELLEARRRRLPFVVVDEEGDAGFDDVPNEALANPPPTTVVQPLAEKGRRAAEMLFAGGPPRPDIPPRR